MIALILRIDRKHRVITATLFCLSNVSAKLFIVYDVFKTTRKFIKSMNETLHNAIVDEEGYYYCSVAGLLDLAVFWAIVPHLIKDIYRSARDDAILVSTAGKNSLMSVYMSSHPRAIKAYEVSKSALNPPLLAFIFSLIVVAIPPLRSLFTSTGSILNVSVYETSLTVGRAMSLLMIVCAGANYRLHMSGINKGIIIFSLIKLIPFGAVGLGLLYLIGLNTNPVLMFTIMLNYISGSSLCFVVFTNYIEAHVFSLSRNRISLIWLGSSSWCPYLLQWSGPPFCYHIISDRKAV